MRKIIEDAILYFIDKEPEIPDDIQTYIPANIMGNNDVAEYTDSQDIYFDDFDCEVADVLDHELVQAIRMAGL
jgi:hypothetical protein